MVADLGNAVWNDNGGKFFTPVKRIIADGSGSLWDGVFFAGSWYRVPDQMSVGFVKKNPVDCLKYRVIRRNRDFCQVFAGLERIGTYGDNAVRDLHAGEAFT